MKQIYKRVIAVLMLAAFLMTGSLNDYTEVLAAVLENTETEDTVVLKDKYVELSVNTKNAGYVLKTREGDILTKTDNNKPLNYRGGEGDTSFATIRIDGKNYIYGNTKNGGKFLTKPYVDANQIKSTWTQGDICVTQTLSLLTDSQDEKLGAVRIEYEVWNTKDASEGEEGTVNVGGRLVIDTQLGAQDYAVYEMAPNDENGTYVQYTRETAILKEDMSAHFRSLDNNYQPRVVAYGYPDESGSTPDKMVFGHWYPMAENLWDYELTGISFVDNDHVKYKTADSAVAMFWNEAPLGAGEKRLYSYYYGIQSNSDVAETDTVKLSVSMDKDYLVLKEDKSGYVEDTVKIQVMVANTLPQSKTRARMAVKLDIDTDYLKVLSAESSSGEEAETGKDVIFLTNVKKGQTRIINWTLQVKNPPETIRYLKYVVKAYGFTEKVYNPDEEDSEEEKEDTVLLDSNVIDSVKRNILAPGISGEKPAVSILAGMPDELYYKGNRTFIVRGDGFDILASDKTEWQLKMTDLQTGEESFIDSTKIQFNSDGTCMLVNFTQEMPEGEYQLTILPGTNLTDEQVGLPESITSDEMKFFMSSDEDLINPPVGGVGIRKETTNGIDRYVIDVFNSSVEAAAASPSKYLLVLTGNLYQTVDETTSASRFIPVHGDGSNNNILINRVVKFSGKEIIVDYLYEDEERVGVQIKMDGNAGVIGGSSKIWSDESKIVLKDGTDYSTNPDEVESGFSKPVCVEMTGIAGVVQKISGFVVDLRYGEFYNRGGQNTISFGGNLSIGFMSVDQYDGVGGVDLFAANVDDVRYGERGFIGVKTSTFIGVPEFMSTLPADMEGELTIDTIDYPYLVNVKGEGKFATFKTDFELEIIGSKKHGVPVPNILSLRVGGIKPGAPIILPVAPIVYLQGAAGKVEGLYSIFYPSENDGWPDTTISLEGQLSIVDVFSGWVGISLGTCRAAIYGDDMKIMGLDFLDSVRAEFIWYPEVSFSMEAHMEIFKIIKGDVRCYLLMKGDNAPDLDMFGRVAIVLPAVFFGEDLTVAGVGIGGNKTKLYGDATVMGMTMSFVYMWGDGSTDVNISLFKARAGRGQSAGSVGISNVNCVAKSTGELAAKAATPMLLSRAMVRSNPTVSVGEKGELIITGMESNDTMIRAYYDVQNEEVLDMKDVKVTINGSSYALEGIETDEDGVAVNMATANYTAGSDELGNYIIVTIPKEKVTGDIVFSSETATFSYGEAMAVNPVASLDSIEAKLESDYLNVTTTMSNLEGAEGIKEVYLSKTAEGDRTYAILATDEEGNSYGMDADTSALEIPYYVPSGDYYVTTLIDGTQNGSDFHSEQTTAYTLHIENDQAPTERLTAVTAKASGDGNALITLEGYDAALMDGVYVVTDRTNADGSVTEGYQAAFVENTGITDSQFEVALSPEETGNDYVFRVYPIKNTAGVEEEPKYAIGYETVSSKINVPYPDAAEVSVTYGTEYVEEEGVLGSGEGEEAITYTNKVFTEVPEDGIRIEAATDKPVTGKILLDDEVVSEITVPGTEFPTYYAKLEDGEHKLRIETQTELGDTAIIDESLKVDTSAPILQLFTPENGSLADKGQITLSGQVEDGKDITVTINGVEADMKDFAVENGSFEKTVQIPAEEQNAMVYEVVVTAADAYGRETRAEASVLNANVDSIESVYLAFNGEKITTDTLSVKGMTEGELSLCGVTTEGDVIVIPDESVSYTGIAGDEDEGEITVDVVGNVKIAGEATTAVSAQYYVTEDYCYQANVLLDSYKEAMKTADAKEPLMKKNLTEGVMAVSAGEEFTLEVEGESFEGGQISYAWYHKNANGEFEKLDVTSSSYTNTLTDEGTVHEYYAVITNKTRTTGVEEASVISPVVTVYVKDTVEEEDIQVSGDSVTTNNVTYYKGDITVKAKEEGVKVALADTEGELQWKEELVLSGEETGALSYPIVLCRNDAYISENYQLTLHKDHTGPEGSITLKENVWTNFFELITFGIFKDTKQTLSLAAEDAHSGMAENGIASYKASATMSAEELDALADTEWSKGTSVTVNEDESSIVYARFEDALGNISYINSDGIVVGDVAPVVEFRCDESTLMEEGFHRYVGKADITVVVKDDAQSKGIATATYRINDGTETPLTITSGQTEASVPVSLNKPGVNTIYVTAKDGNGNEATTCETVEIYQLPEVTLTAAEGIEYDGSTLEAEKDLILSTGASKGAVSWSYREAKGKDYQEGLPVNAGEYEVKVSLAKDAKNFYAPVEKSVELTIEKAQQVLQFSSDCYKPVIGKRFLIIAGGISSEGEITVKSKDTKVVKLAEDEMVYDKETHVVSVPAEALAKGSTSVTVSVKGDDNHKEAEQSVNVQVTEEVTAEHPYFINAIVGNNGWYRSDVYVTPAAGYGVADRFDGVYQDVYAITGEGEKLGPDMLYFRNPDGEYSEHTIDKVKIDMTVPEGTIKAGESGWRQFLNFITFGVFFKDTVVVGVEDATDAVSGMDTIRYYQSETPLTMEEVMALNDSDWSKNKVTLEPDSKAFVYAALSDKAGNITYLSTDGIIADKTPALITVKPSYDTQKWITAAGANIQVTATDAMAGFAADGITYQIDGGTVFAGAQTFTVSGLADGIHNVLITAVDKSGNKTTTTVPWKQDTKAPTLALSNKGNNTIGITATAGVSGIASVTIARNGGKFEDITKTYASGYTVKDDGTYEVRLMNHAGVVVSKTIKMTLNRKSQKIKVKKSKYKVRYGQKAFKLNAKSNKGTSLTYKTSNKKVVTVNKKGKVTIKGCGKANIIITAKQTAQYKKATKKIAITVTPKQAKLKSVTAQSGRIVTVKWARDKKASGYEISYAANKKFKKASKHVIKKNKTTALKISKFPTGKTYYVRVRSFKQVGKKKVYGPYSKALTVMAK